MGLLSDFLIFVRSGRPGGRHGGLQTHKTEKLMHFPLFRRGIAALPLLLALAVSCGTDKNSGAGETRLDTFSAKSNASFFQDVYSDVRIIPIQLDGEVLGSSLNVSLKEKEDRYILVDQVTQTVFSFDRTGKPLGRIRKPGRGPGEYSQLVSCDYADGKYTVLADGGHIIEYDAQGDMLREFFLERDLMDVAVVDGSPVLLASRIDGEEDAEADRILVCDASYQPQSSFCPEGFQLFNYSSVLTPVAGEEGSFLYVEPISTQLYKCNKEGILHTYVVDFNGKAMSEKLRNADDYEVILGVLESEPDIFCYEKAFENGNHLLLAVEHLESGSETEIAHWLVDKRDGSSRIEYMDYDGELFGFLGVPMLLTEQDEVVYVVDTEMFDAAVAAVPSLAAVKGSLPASFSGPALLVCKIK